MKKSICGFVLALLAGVALAADRPNVPTPVQPVWPPELPPLIVPGPPVLTSFIVTPEKVDVSLVGKIVHIRATAMSASLKGVKSITVYIDDGTDHWINGINLLPPWGCVRMQCVNSPYGTWFNAVLIRHNDTLRYQGTTNARLRVIVNDNLAEPVIYEPLDLENKGFIHELIIHDYDISIDYFK